LPADVADLGVEAAALSPPQPALAEADVRLG
jgi:hypothetical protein